jgi:hypothetical protein
MASVKTIIRIFSIWESGLLGMLDTVVPQLSNLPTSNTYTASGPIALTDQKSVVKGSFGTLAMTLGSGITDGQTIVIKRLGAAIVTLTATIDGVFTTLTLSTATPPYEALWLVWDAANATWELI